MRIRYIGLEEGVEAFGEAFWQGVWRNIAHLDDEVRATLDGNPQFETEPVIEAVAVKSKTARAK